MLELRSRIYFRNLWCESSHREFTSKILGNAENFILLFDCVNGAFAIPLIGHRPKRYLLRCLVVGLLVASAQATELKADTAAAFERYIRATEAEHADDLRKSHFLVIDRLPDPSRNETYAKLRQGQIYIEQLHTKEGGRPISIPGGLVHHWVGVIFIPVATLSQVLAVLQDYDNHKNIYKPDVRRSKLLKHGENEFKVYLQFYRKSIVTVVINANFDVHYTMLGSKRALSQSYSTRIAEVENPDKPKERELPVGNDHGYLWRLDNFWRVEEKDGGTYIQVESVGLSRAIPAIFAWLINPLLKNIPRTVLSNLLNATRRAVANRASTKKNHVPLWPTLEHAGSGIRKHCTRRVGSSAGEAREPESVSVAVLSALRFAIARERSRYFASKNFSRIVPVLSMKKYPGRAKPFCIPVASSFSTP